MTLAGERIGYLASLPVARLGLMPGHGSASGSLGTAGTRVRATDERMLQVEQDKLKLIPRASSQRENGIVPYARVPLFDWIRDCFELSRNHYDKVGHFAQGFIPALITREVLLRTTPLRKGKMLLFLVLCVCLAFSAVYELVEWVVAEITEAEDFLGTQGDVWDTQKDMACCLVGAIIALLLLSRRQDQELQAVMDVNKNQ